MCLQYIYTHTKTRDAEWQVLIHVFFSKVKARSAAREVIATYSVDDIFIELIIQLPSNYPLGSITVESGKRVGVAVQQWRNWMLQLSTYLTHQVNFNKVLSFENLVSPYSRKTFLVMQYCIDLCDRSHQTANLRRIGSLTICFSPDI